jgi:hypothetical protein
MRSLVLRQGLANFLPKLALNCNFSILTSQVAGITGINHHTPLRLPFWDRVLLYSPQCPEIHCGPELMIFLPQSPEWWDYRCSLPCLVYNNFLLAELLQLQWRTFNRKHCHVERSLVEGAHVLKVSLVGDWLFIWQVSAKTSIFTGQKLNQKRILCSLIIIFCFFWDKVSLCNFESQSSCLSLLSAGIIHTSHHAQLLSLFFFLWCWKLNPGLCEY